MLNEFLEILRTASPNNIKELRIRQLVDKQREAEGYIVELRGPWETIQHICKRLNISASKFRRRWKRRPMATSADFEAGPSGRLIQIRSNVQLDRFLRGSWSLDQLPAQTAVRILIEIPADKSKARKKRS